MSADSSGGASRNTTCSPTIAAIITRADTPRAAASTANQATNNTTRIQPKPVQVVGSPRPANGPASQSGNDRTPPGTRNDGAAAASNTSTSEAVSSAVPPAAARI